MDRGVVSEGEKDLPMVSTTVWLVPAFTPCFFLALVAWGRARPLRRRVEPAAPHLVRNLATGALSAAILAVLDRPVTSLLAGHVEAQRVGLLPSLGLPRVAEIGL